MKKNKRYGKNNNLYIDGRWSKKAYCKYCKKRIWYTAKTCKKCYLERKVKPINFTNKGRKHSKKAKEAISKAKKGNKNPMFGKPTPFGKWAKYKNTYMRSSWEIAYAKYLDKNNIKWEYEPKRFILTKHKTSIHSFFSDK